jgi:glyoxylate/hydroxypyruvate reductase
MTKDHTLRVTVYTEGVNPAPWVDGLRHALPRADVGVWAPGAPPASYAVVWAPPQALLDEQTGLRAVFNIGAGVDALLALRWPNNLPMVRLDDAGMGTQMAEYVCHAVMRHVREFDVMEAQMRAGQWAFRKPRLRADFPVAVLGLGVLGTRVAKALRHFDFEVHGWSRSAKQVEGVTTHHGAQALAPMLKRCRLLVNLLPLTDDTRDLLDKPTLSCLQPDGYVINVARGAHLVDDDLIALLDSGHLAGAMLDVFRQEPLPPEHPFWRHPKITLTPHASARTLREESLAQIAGKIAALERGEPCSALAGVVDVARGY